MMRATCMRAGYRLRNRGWLHHDAPHAGCQCGIYAADSAATAVGLATERGHEDPRVFGRVALWGLVAEREYGWKASNAYPSEIVIPERWFRSARGPALEAVALDLTDYGVPVSLADRDEIASLAEAGCSNRLADGRQGCGPPVCSERVPMRPASSTLTSMSPPPRLSTVESAV